MNIHYDVPQNPILTIIRAQGPLVVFSFKTLAREAKGSHLCQPKHYKPLGLQLLSGS